MSDEFIQIPSYLTDGTTNESTIRPMATGCTDFCEVYDECCNYENCMGSCETCQDGCQTSGCQTTCQESCQSTCQKSCQTNCEESCQSACESVCQLACENACQYACENYCMTECESCETACQGTCLDACQVCEGVCQTNCEIDCQTCQTTCQKYCETACQLGCQSGQTNPKLPNPTLDTLKTIKTGNSISITINSVSGATTYYARINGGSRQSSSGRTFTFYGLLPNTQYLIEIKVSGSGYEDSDWAGYYATTLSVELWSWTTTELNAFNNNGLTTVLTYQRWNAFVDKIYEVSNNDWWISSTDGATLSYSATKMTSTDRILTAERFNSVRYNIGARKPTGISRVYKDDDVLGSYFITLGNKLNEWIQS